MKFMKFTNSFKSAIILSMISFSTFAQTVTDNTISVDVGKELLLKKCAQCHTDSIWRDQRQDERAWEATLYRMMGRGAIWTPEEIKSMAFFLGNDYGKQALKNKNY